MFFYKTLKLSDLPKIIKDTLALSSFHSLPLRRKCTGRVDELLSIIGKAQEFFVNNVGTEWVFICDHHRILPVRRYVHGRNTGHDLIRPGHPADSQSIRNGAGASRTDRGHDACHRTRHPTLRVMSPVGSEDRQAQHREILLSCHAVYIDCPRRPIVRRIFTGSGILSSEIN